MSITINIFINSSKEAQIKTRTRPSSARVKQAKSDSQVVYGLSSPSRRTSSRKISGGAKSRRSDEAESYKIY